MRRRRGHPGRIDTVIVPSKDGLGRGLERCVYLLQEFMPKNGEIVIIENGLYPEDVEKFVRGLEDPRVIALPTVVAGKGEAVAYGMGVATDQEIGIGGQRNFDRVAEKITETYNGLPVGEGYRGVDHRLVFMDHDGAFLTSRAQFDRMFDMLGTSDVVIGARQFEELSPRTKQTLNARIRRMTLYDACWEPGMLLDGLRPEEAFEAVDYIAGRFAVRDLGLGFLRYKNVQVGFKGVQGYAARELFVNRERRLRRIINRFHIPESGSSLEAATFGFDAEILWHARYTHGFDVAELPVTLMNSPVNSALGNPAKALGSILDDYKHIRSEIRWGWGS